MTGKYDKEQLIADVSAPVNLTNKSYIAWMGFLTIILIFCLYHYFIQLQVGLGVTGLGDHISWGMYIANFVFFVASSLIGMLISSVLGLIGMKWVTPITRIAEIIAIAFAAVAGLVIVSDMGRPDRLIYVFVHGRFQSPILWDITVVTTYVVISLLLYFLPLIPDLKYCKNKISNAPKWMQNVYEILSLNWAGTPEQATILRRAIRVLLILIIPVALSIHTVTSWLFAVTPRPGWDSTIFGPYFVSGAFVAGCAAVIIAMFFFRINYKLHKYIEESHFDKMGKLLVLVSLVYLYFNLNEYLVPGYKLKHADAVHLHELFAGSHAIMFWAVQIGGLILPIILLLFRGLRKPLPIAIIAFFMIVGAWFKRYLIVIPTMEHPYLPMQHVPQKFVHYSPTFSEIAITIAPIVMVLMIISVLSKIFPVLPVYEMTEEHHDEENSAESGGKKPKTSKIPGMAMILLLFLLPGKSLAQTWTIPDDNAERVSPFKFTDESIKKGSKLYQDNCMICHGSPTKGDYNKTTTPAPGDISTSRFQDQKDGELFYKITKGRGPMPAFNLKLTDEERWQVVAYLRSFNPGYKQPEPLILPKGVYSGLDIKVDFEYLPESKGIKVLATGVSDSIVKPISDVEAMLFAVRYFGNKPIDETRVTKADGTVIFSYTDSIPGDTAGNVKFVLRFNADGLEGFRKEATLKIGKPVNKPGLTETRAMWTVRSQAPIWLIVLYGTVVIGVWSFLGYILVLIKKIYDAGKNNPGNNY